MMTAPVAVSEQDLRTLAGIMNDYRADLPAEGLPPSLLADLMGQIRCDEIDFTGVDSVRQVTRFTQGIPPGPADIDRRAVVDQEHWKYYWDFELDTYNDRTGDLRAIVKISDFYSARQWHATRVYCDHYRPQGLEHELQLCLPEAPGETYGPGRTVRLCFCRGPGADFSERDRALLMLLRPHLHQAYLDAERRRHPIPQLTPRHWDLLRLLAAGHTNSQIARRLGLSEGTVRTHLENIYTRLNVSSRTAAVTRAFPDLVALVLDDVAARREQRQLVRSVTQPGHDISRGQRLISGFHGAWRAGSFPGVKIIEGCPNLSVASLARSQLVPRPRS